MNFIGQNYVMRLSKSVAKGQTTEMQKVDRNAKRDKVWSCHLSLTNGTSY